MCSCYNIITLVNAVVPPVATNQYDVRVDTLEGGVYVIVPVEILLFVTPVVTNVAPPVSTANFIFTVEEIKKLYCIPLRSFIDLPLIVL